MKFTAETAGRLRKALRAQIFWPFTNDELDIMRMALRTCNQYDTSDLLREADKESKRRVDKFPFEG